MSTPKIRTSEGFSEKDQEAIAVKFQKLADHRTGRTGLGFATTSSEHESDDRVPPKSGPPQITVPKEKTTQEDKVKSLKASIHTIETNHATAALHRRHAIAEIEGQADAVVDLAHVTVKDAQHQSAIFSTQIPDSTTVQHAASNPVLFNRKKPSASSDADAPLYKRLAVGDTVNAYYAGNGQFHRAEIMSVMHGGYHSAMYDVKYHGYHDKATLSWTDLSPFSDLKDEVEDENNSIYAEGIERVDAFGRSLSERPTQPQEVTESAAGVRVRELCEDTNAESSIAAENINASGLFLRNLMESSPSHPQPQPRPQLKTHAEINLEAPILALHFSLDSIVDGAFFHDRAEGSWRSLCCE